MSILIQREPLSLESDVLSPCLLEYPAVPLNLDDPPDYTFIHLIFGPWDERRAHRRWKKQMA
ncbi:hypothetical protein DPMN_175455 [Dreissena polymorpha]|uniref:Uncharacterized protein n=1 Tax=Dreissena polymorpha TaxID=45954 RepID=A0A9D4E574_DREPO|nr:hypothetical protein DPMN_175455 [Dreissena polymorpha]